MSAELQRLAAYETRAVIVECGWPDLERGDWRSKVLPQSAVGSVLGWIAAGIPFVLAGSREKGAAIHREAAFHRCAPPLARVAFAGRDHRRGRRMSICDVTADDAAQDAFRLAIIHTLLTRIVRHGGGVLLDDALEACRFELRENAWRIRNGQGELSAKIARAAWRLDKLSCRSWSTHSVRHDSA